MAMTSERVISAIVEACKVPELPKEVMLLLLNKPTDDAPPADWEEFERKISLLLPDSPEETCEWTTEEPREWTAKETRQWTTEEIQKWNQDQ